MTDMKSIRQPVIIGNWKMHPTSRASALKLVRDIKKKIGTRCHALVSIAPPFPYLDAAHAILPDRGAVSLAAQDVFPKPEGAYTSQISIPMLQDLGVQYVILGHSERRALGETDTVVQEKLAAVIKSGLTGVVCIGESDRDQGGQYLSHVEDQLRSAFRGMSKSKLDHVIVAYEPLWAIGTGVTATPEDVHEIRLFIERILTDMYGRNNARRVRVLYGGSVNAKNAEALYTHGTIDGFLVGGSSLKAEEFAAIIHATRGS
jgi:triosephosphate isomerase (TIM)